MRNRGQVILGVVLLGLGLLLLLDRLVGIRLGLFCWPVGLMALGVLILLRPSMVGPDTGFSLYPLAGVKRQGAWNLRDEEIWIGIGDVKLDLHDVTLPEGETTLRIFGFISDIDVSAPEDLPLALTTSAFVADAKAPGFRKDAFLSSAQWQSPTYDDAPQRLRLEVTAFIVDVDVRT